MAMTRLRFQPIQGKSLDIIGTILQTEEMAPVVTTWNIIRVVVEELVVNIVDYSHSDYLDVEITRDGRSLSLRFRARPRLQSHRPEPVAEYKILYEHAYQSQCDDDNASQLKGVEISKPLLLFLAGLLTAAAVVLLPFASCLIVIRQPVF